MLFNTWNDAFSGYARTWTKAELENDLARRGYMPGLSFGAFDGAKLVAFTLNGIGEFNKIKTAYDTGTGTIEAYRGKGLATKIFQYSLPLLKEAGAKQYLLEVLKQNETAISVYTKLGFSITREFNYFLQDNDKIKRKLTDESCNFRRIELYQLINAGTEQMQDFHPSWQNSFDALLKMPDGFKTVGAFDGNELTGYGIIEPATGDIPQFAVSRERRRQGIGSSILKELLKYNDLHSVKIVNTDASYEGITAFLEANNIPQRGMQLEMIKPVS